MFTIAEDLAKLRLEVSVDEADVGAVKVGQKASFTVSAYPSRRYPARITRVAFGSTKTDNVITYTTWLEVNNTDLSLRPGMTAASTIVATERNDVLLVPNTALRFTPAETAAAAPAASGSVVSKLMPRMPPRAGGRRPASTNGTAVRQIWVLQDGQAVAVAVTPGISDGRMTEVSGPDLKEGMAVITDQRAAGAAPVSERLAPTLDGAPEQPVTGAPGAMPLIRLRGITKTYGEGTTAFQALKGVDLDIHAGDFVAIMGPSGSGKSTAMNTLGCLDRPTTGAYHVPGRAGASRSHATSARGCGGATSASCSRASTCWRAPRRRKTWNCH